MMKDFFLFPLIIIVSLSLRIALGEAKKHRELVYNASVLSMKEFIQNRIDQTENSPDIEQILQSLTLREKIAQMTQVDIYSMVDATNRDPYTALKKEKVIEYAQVGIGSILNAPFPDPVGMGGKTGWTATEWQIVLNQIKEIYRQHAKVPMIYGIDTIHGATYVRGATLFGQPLSAASSFNLDYVYKMGEIEAKDTLAAGISWIFSPVLGISTQPKWARVYETFGEDPYLSSQMGASIIRGIQSSGKVAACMKHFIGYSNPTSGLDRADSVINDWDLVNHYAPSFLAATKAGVKTAMETYASLNGVPVIGSHKLLIDLLRNDMKFQGMLVSDYSEVDRMFFEHHVASSVAQAVNISLTETSLDMNMGPVYSDFIHITEDLVRRKIIPESRLDESVRRILDLKKQLGVLESEIDISSDEHISSVGGEEDQRISLDLARESVTLLENRNATLPIPLNTSDVSARRKIFVTGPLSDNKGYMCGGWSVFWQGSSNSSYFPHGYTIKDALIKKVNGSIDVIHDEVVDIKGNMSEEDFQRGLEKASQSDYTIVAVGEENYAEKTGDIYDLRLAVGLRRYIEALSTRVPMTKVIVILITGRPRLLEQATKYSDAVLLSFLPCEQGGEAIVDILVGDINPSGKLPITYPKSSTLQLPYFHRVNTVCQPWQECPVEWEFGYGLSYTTFDYSNLRINTSNITAEETLLVELTVKNTGLVSGKETVLLFLSQRYRMANVPERKLLKKFRKIELIPGEQQRVRFTLNAEDIGFYQPHIGYGFQRVVDKGEYEISTLQSHHADQGNKITSATIRFNVV